MDHPAHRQLHRQVSNLERDLNVLDGLCIATQFFDDAIQLFAILSEWLNRLPIIFVGLA
jgi:hypothetical protein